MSLIPAEFYGRIPPPIKRALCLIRNGLALLGAVLLVVAISILSKGGEMTRDMDPRTRRALGDFVFRVQHGDVASAMVIRAPVSAGVSRSEAEKAMRRRAREIDLEVHGAQSYSLAADSGEGRREITVIRFCEKKTVEALLALRPELGALLPCTIVLVADPDGRSWVATLNMELLMYGGKARDKMLESKLLALKDRLLDVMAAAAAVPAPNPSEG